MDTPLTRRDLGMALGLGAAGLLLNRVTAQEPKPKKIATFQIACMTINYAQYPLPRALDGIKKAGYQYVAWGTTHKTDGKSVPVLANDAPIAEAKELAKKCTDLGLTSVMLFGPGPDNVEALTTRIKQAQAAGIGHVLVMGSTRGNDLKKWIENLKKLGPIAADHNVTIGIKPHGGNTGMGEKIAAVTKEVNHPRVKISYDAGNVMDYHKVDPLPDLKKCADEVRSFCIKDHRAFPVDEDCGPGLGEIDHYKLLAPVLSLGETIPLCCENIFEPVLPRPQGADGIDVLARRAREFLETVVKGLTLSAQGKK